MCWVPQRRQATDSCLSSSNWGLDTGGRSPLPPSLSLATCLLVTGKVKGHGL